MGRRIQNVSRTLVCSLVLGFVGCSGFTIGPTIERKAIIVHSGVPIECIEDIEVESRILTDDGTAEPFRQNIGGWILMHPDHWKTLKAEINRLRGE